MSTIPPALKFHLAVYDHGQALLEHVRDFEQATEWLRAHERAMKEMKHSALNHDTERAPPPFEHGPLPPPPKLPRFK